MSGGRNRSLSKLLELLANALWWALITALVGSFVFCSYQVAFAQMPPQYYGLTPGPLVISPTIENAIEPPAGQLVVIDPPPPIPVPLPPPLPPLVTYYVIDPPPIVAFGDDLDDLAPLIQTRVILTRSCFRYVNRWHCTQPK